MRPSTLNRDSSAISKTLPQCGHFGRRKFSVATTAGDGFGHADGTIIVDPPRRSITPTSPLPIGSIVRVPYGDAATTS